MAQLPQLVAAALLVAGAAGALFQPGAARTAARAGWRARAAAPPVCFETLAKTSGSHSAPSDAESAALVGAKPQPALQPREVVATMLHALHRSNWDRPLPYAGFATALRFLSPSHQYRSFERSKQYTPQSYARYLRQPHKAALLAWDEYRWDGDVTLIQGEAYQQTSVRDGPDSPWTSVRWLLKRVDRAKAEAAASGKGEGTAGTAGGASQWMVDAVFTDEPDGGEDAAGPAGLAPLSREEQRDLFREIDISNSGSISPAALVDVIASLGVPRAEAEGLARTTDSNSDGVIDFDEFAKLLNKVNQKWSTAGSFARMVTDGVRSTAANARSPRAVVDLVMRALRAGDDPYPLHGAEVAVQLCSPTNPAAQLTPATFATYLSEPHYAILTEWDHIEFDQEEEELQDHAGSTADTSVLVKRDGDDSFTYVNFILSRHSGRWLIDSLSIV